MSVDRSSKMNYMKRINRMYIVIKLFYNYYLGWKFHMNRYGDFLNIKRFILALLLFNLTACATTSSHVSFRDPAMDFAALRTIAVMPFANFTRNTLAGERVRDAFINNMLSTGALYVIPSGEVARGILKAGIVNATAPSSEDIAKLGAIIKADAVITGVVREYGEVRSGSASGNIISLSLQMIEVQTRKIVWTASSSKGGISVWDRLLGSGGKPMNEVTEAAINDILNQLFE